MLAGWVSFSAHGLDFGPHTSLRASYQPALVVLRLVSDLTSLLDMAAQMGEIIFSCCGPLQEVPWKMSLAFSDADSQSVGTSNCRRSIPEEIQAREAGWMVGTCRYYALMIPLPEGRL